MAKREGEVLFKGRSWEWGNGGGSTGENHPFRRKSQKAYDQYHQRLKEQEEINSKTLELLGIPAHLDAPERLEDPLEELDRFVESEGLERRGIDVVFERFERARRDHDEQQEDER